MLVSLTARRAKPLDDDGRQPTDASYAMMQHTHALTTVDSCSRRARSADATRPDGAVGAAQGWRRAAARVRAPRLAARAEGGRLGDSDTGCVRMTEPLSFRVDRCCSSTLASRRPGGASPWHGRAMVSSPPPCKLGRGAFGAAAAALPCAKRWSPFLLRARLHSLVLLLLCFSRCAAQANAAAQCRALLAAMDARGPSDGPSNTAAWSRLGCDHEMLLDRGIAQLLVDDTRATPPVADDGNSECRLLLREMDGHPARAASLQAKFDAASCGRRMREADAGDATVLVSAGS